ncbi:MAG: hypothetical protein NTY09_06450 [bacterium]|nr:hypothetical protein [bacterium]
MKSIIVVFLITSSVIFICGCPKGQADEKPESIFRDAYSFYVLDPGPFEAVDPEYPAPREFLILKADNVEISCGVFKGAGIEVQGERLSLSIFANDTIISEDWLPGVSRYLLDGSSITIGDREFYVATLLVRRDPEMTARMDSITRAVHSREFVLYPNNEDRIVKLYYSPQDKDVCILTLSGTPEDLAYREPDIRRLLASVKLTASEAVQGTDGEASAN